MLWDHGMPRPDGTVNPEQRPEADVNIEFRSTSKLADQSMKLAMLPEYDLPKKSVLNGCDS